MFRNVSVLQGGFVNTSPNTYLEDHLSSAVRDCLFNLFAANLLIGGRLSIRNMRTRHAVVTGIHYRGKNISDHKIIFVHCPSKTANFKIKF